MTDIHLLSQGDTGVLSRRLRGRVPWRPIMTAATGKTLLVVDDDTFVRDMLTLILGNAGHTVVTAANGLHGLDYLRNHPVADLIILDMMMPDLDGWTFMRVRSQE